MGCRTGGRLHRAAGGGWAVTCSLGRLGAHVDEEVAIFEAHHMGVSMERARCRVLLECVP